MSCLFQQVPAEATEGQHETNVNALEARKCSALADSQTQGRAASDDVSVYCQSTSYETAKSFEKGSTHAL